MNKSVGLVDFLNSLPSNYTAELYYYWESKDIRFGDDGEPSEGLDAEISQCDTVEKILGSDFDGYGSYWNDIQDVYGVKISVYGYFSRITIDHIKKNVEMNYIRFR